MTILSFIILEFAKAYLERGILFLQQEPRNIKIKENYLLDFRRGLELDPSLSSFVIEAFLKFAFPLELLSEISSSE